MRHDATCPDAAPGRVSSWRRNDRTPLSALSFRRPPRPRKAADWPAPYAARGHLPGRVRRGRHLSGRRMTQTPSLALSFRGRRGRGNPLKPPGPRKGTRPLARTERWGGVPPGVGMTAGRRRKDSGGAAKRRGPSGKRGPFSSSYLALIPSAGYRRANLRSPRPARAKAARPPMARRGQELEELSRPASPVFGGVMPVPVRGAVTVAAGAAIGDGAGHGDLSTHRRRREDATEDRLYAHGVPEKIDRRESRAVEKSSAAVHRW